MRNFQSILNAYFVFIQIFFSKELLFNSFQQFELSKDDIARKCNEHKLEQYPSFVSEPIKPPGFDSRQSFEFVVITTKEKQTVPDEVDE